MLLKVLYYAGFYWFWEEILFFFTVALRSTSVELGKLQNMHIGHVKQDSL